MNIGKLLELRAYVDDAAAIIAYSIAIASIIVKLTPTIRDNEILLKIIKFLSKYVALTRTVNDKKIRKELQKQIKHKGL